MGIDDRDSWLLREYYPTGRATGWRRTGCLLMIGLPLALIVIALLATALTR